MKIFNYSHIECDKLLWHTVAKGIGLDGIIRDAELVDRKELTVVIHEAQTRSDEDRFLYGKSTLGRIDLYPCISCTAGAVALTFLHELAHVWIHEFHEEDIFDDWNEAFCDEFAFQLFEEVGRKPDAKECHLIALQPQGEYRFDAGRIIAAVFDRYRSRSA